MVVRKGLDRVREVDVMEPGTQALDVVKDTLFINQVIPFSVLRAFGSGTAQLVASANQDERSLVTPQASAALIP